MIELNLHLHRETKQGEPKEGALKVSDDGHEDGAVWLPKSQVEFEIDRNRRTVSIRGPEWLLRNEGLI